MLKHRLTRGEVLLVLAAILMIGAVAIGAGQRQASQLAAEPSMACPTEAALMAGGEQCPIEKVLEQLPLAPEMRGALLGEDNACRRRLECVIAYESGDWMRALELAERAQIDPLKLRSAHAEALRWVETLTHEK